jgi:hypothetical protein
MKRYSGAIILFFIPLLIKGQGEIDTQEKILYRDERSFAVLLNSNGVGGNFRYARRITYLKKTLYEADFAFIKHPKEVRVTSSSYYNSSRNYVYGKANSFYNIRLGLGYQNEVFQKHDKGGISVRYFYNAGLDIGLLKPIYYTYRTYRLVSENVYVDSFFVERFKDQHPAVTEIVGKASFFKGFDEIAVIPGLYGKLGVTFEFGNSEKIINALEAGVIIDAFPKKIPIMATEENSQFFLSLFISYRFGRGIDVSNRVRKKTKIDEILIQ